MEEIVLGYTIAKPVETQEQCTAYAAMAEAVSAHNAACAVGDTLWVIEDKADCYEVAEGGTVPEPEPASTLPTMEERVDALESANDDIILMMADLIGG
jgi:hypothetical protein